MIGKKSIMSKNVYAIVRDGEIAEYPMSDENVRMRSLPHELLTPVIYDQDPPPASFNTRVVEHLRLEENTVHVKYSVEERSIGDMLSETHALMRSWHPRTPMSPALYLIVCRMRLELINMYRARIDDVAKSMGYVNACDLASFINSGIEKYAKSAKAIIELRDAFWSAFYDYMERCEAGKTAYPARISDIDTQLPALQAPVIDY